MGMPVTHDIAKWNCSMIQIGQGSITTTRMGRMSEVAEGKFWPCR